MSHQRIIWADAQKGCLIMLVVLGHAIQNTLGDACEANHLWNIIYSFHMAAFMAVSGYVAFRPNTKWEGQFVYQTISRRFRQLIVPFILWAIISQLVGGGIDVGKIGLYFLYPDKSLWFLWVLFFINIIFLLGSYVGNKIKIRQEWVAISICLILVSIMVLFEVRVFGFQFIAYYFMFYGLGYFFHKYEDRLALSSIFFLVLLGICWIVLAWFWKMHELPIFMKGLPLPDTIMQYIYRFITAAIAVYQLLVLSPKILNGTHKWNRPLVYLGKISLGIYAVHFMLLGKWVKLFNEIGMNEECVIVCTFALTLTTTWIIVWLLSKWHITATWLLGKI